MNLAFDISDIVIFVQHNRRVSGIQRVVLNLLRHAASAGHAVVFCDPASGGFYQVDPAALGDGEYSGQAITAALGVAKRRLPPRFKYRDRPFKRAYHQTRYRLEGLLSGRGDLKGIKRWTPQPGKTRYLVLGAPWSNPHLEPALADLRALSDIEPVILIHDLRPLIAPEQETVTNHAYLSWFSSGAKIYERFLAYSSRTESDLRSLLVAEGRKIEWIRRIPMAHEFLSNGNTAVPELDGRDFVLAVCPLSLRHKNGEGLLRAWGQIADIMGDATPTLVLAGSHGKALPKLAAAGRNQPGLASKLLAINEPSDAELAWLYQNCRFTAFPSFFEGWGLPVGESAWMGKLCVASNRAAIPEVLGDYADYFDPASDADMVRALLRPLQDSGYLRQREHGLKQLRLRAWRETASGLLSAVEDDKRRSPQ